MATTRKLRALRWTVLAVAAVLVVSFGIVHALMNASVSSGPNEPAQAEFATNPLTGGGQIPAGPVLPLAFSVDNLASARPQTGLESASLVYELPVEGGITRFLAFYLGEDIPVVGPIRSVRPYTIDVAEQYHAVLIHCGGSPDALERLAPAAARHINQIESQTGFFRSKDRKAPHNLYGQVKVLRAKAAQLFDVALPEAIQPPWVWGNDDTAEYPPAQSINMFYWPDYTVGYRYDSAKGTYARLVNGRPHKSASGPLEAAHVAVQFVHIQVLDDKGRLKLGTPGAQKGRLLMFTGGRVVEGSWVQEGARTDFLGPSGEPLKLKPGVVWVHLVPVGRKVTWQ